MADPDGREGQGRNLTHPAVVRLLAERDALRQQPVSGLERVRALASSMDDALRALWDTGARGAALVALGGYGRGELSPHSDIDIAVVCRRSKPEALVKRVLYALWDAGFEVGHGTRTVKESLRLAAEDLEAHTSLLEARLIAGEESLLIDLRDAMETFTRKQGTAFAQALAAATAKRHAAAGDVPFLLEPNFKDGAGGLRDLHVCRWLSRFFDAAPEIADRQGHAELLHRIRNRLHDTTERRTDVLLLAQQDAVAAGLGYAGGRPGDDLMRDFYSAARAIWWHAQTSLATTTGGGMVLPDVARFQAGAWTRESRHAFLDLLRGGSAHTLEALDQAGVMARMFPGWDQIRSLPQRNIYHRFTVDVHCFETVAQLAMLELAGDADRLAGDVWRDIADRDRLMLAGLFHDSGKGSGEDHAIKGERLAEQWVRAMGLGDDAAAEIAWLVRHHLLLAETATRRDTGDQRLVESVAAQVGSAERLKMLYVLTVADAKATGPEAWTPWKAALVAELFVKASNVMERGAVVGRDADALIKRRTAEVREALTGREAGEIDAHLLGMTRGYVLAFPGGSLARHFTLMHPPLEEGEVRLNAVPAGEPGVHEVTFVARDRPGLFATMSGALAVRGINILDAQGFTRADGVALQVYRVAGALERSFDDTRWNSLRQTAGDVLAGRIDLPAEITERRRAYAQPSKGKREPTIVVVDNTTSDFATVVEVHATDRVGLLYDITSALAQMGLDIQAARVATYGHDVVDVFYVRDLLGQRITEPDQVQQLRADLLSRLDPGAAPRQ